MHSFGDIFISPFLSVLPSATNSISCCCQGLESRAFNPKPQTLIPHGQTLNSNRLAEGSGEELRARLSELEEKGDALSAGLAASKEKEDTLSASLQDVRGERDALSAKISWLEHEREGLILDAASGGESARVALLHVEGLERLLESISSRIASISGERDALCRQRDGLAAEFGEAASQRDAACGERDALRLEVDELASAITAIEGTTRIVDGSVEFLRGELGRRVRAERARNSAASYTAEVLIACIAEAKNVAVRAEGFANEEMQREEGQAAAKRAVDAVIEGAMRDAQVLISAAQVTVYIAVSVESLLIDSCITIDRVEKSTALVSPNLPVIVRPVFP